ncbi:hypothetical protein D3C86_1719470 [compost metagenome]
MAATSSATEVSGFCTAVTCRPAACKRVITSAQLEPSAQEPCTSTTLLALTGAVVVAAMAEPVPSMNRLAAIRQSLLNGFMVWTLVIISGRRVTRVGD